MKFKLSPSALNLMKECPRCFWLNKHKKWKRPNGIFPSLPNGMDRILKEHFDRFMSEGKLPPEIKDDDRCNKMKLFENQELLEVWRNNFKGVRWEDGNGNVLFGAVDNILEHNGKLVVLDYKTRGFPLKEDTADRYQNQLDIYNFLLGKNGFDTENFAFLLFYVSEKVLETGEVIFKTYLKKMNIDVSNAEKLFEKAINLLNNDCPKEECDWCRSKK